ncbi:4-hydroxythreonine-4-phosphate dehydrogenase [Candidatus Photodesmus blepharus]|uniref:4-hydroxythreonine-4-phosphate dehydrogenase n=1 Tax=Candidatus Photodesmus blepharonis TaxID=1179155 RepID=A0A084CM15_9GAMM|nr:4-hydroxythreonine-4-phosphate dehydrogenase PdxA [Candidatus Photodesmus blepharus]KEY90844.1 4-hydroxythreonine-4-phosphate dehydrogenase [Candidatus Photodesmus blepharus]
MTIKRIAVTTGEPAGIGPDLVLAQSTQKFPHELIVFSDKGLLTERAQLLGIDVELMDYNSKLKPKTKKAGQLIVAHIPLEHTVTTGKLNKRNSPYVLNILEKAILGCINCEFDAIVTCPIHKGVINQAGIEFTGHTEFFAKKSNTPLAVMMLVTKNIKVALVTTHIPLASVPKAITKDRLEKTIHIIHKELVEKFAIKKPSIYVCGLNPHAGENGFLGKEEIEIITPTLEKIRKQDINIIGPLPADTIFNSKHLQNADIILGMYHDQVLPALKYKSFSRLVNITLGLPFIRTSVDHGTALELAGKKIANIESFKAALIHAIELVDKKTNTFF